MAAQEDDYLSKLLDKKAQISFEEKRRQALAQYQAKTGKPSGFQLSENEALAKKEAPSWKVPDNHTDNAPAAPVSPQRAAGAPQTGAVDAPAGAGLSRYMEESDKRERELQQRLEEENRRKKDEIANMSASGLAKYEEQAQQRDRELKQRLEDEDRRRKEELAHLTASGLAKYEEQAQQRDRELKQRLDDQGRQKQAEGAAQTEKLRLYREKTEAEEREFRRKREEEEARKREQLAAMDAADRARREAALQRSKEDENARRAQATAEAAARNRAKCATCGLDLAPEGTMHVKGKTYCYGCSIAAGADTCASCQKPILGGVVMKALNRKYHPDCLKCGRCRGSLQEGFRQRKSGLYCIPCSPQVKD